MPEQTIYVVMCKQLYTGLEPFAWEAHFDRIKAESRKNHLQSNNQLSNFNILKTKLVLDGVS